jgi:predicted RNase H-like HicB family nuclease
MTRYLIMLEHTDGGFAVQVPDLAISTFGENIEAARKAAQEAIESNLTAYREAEQIVPEAAPVAKHLANPEFKDLLFAYVDVPGPHGQLAA